MIGRGKFGKMLKALVAAAAAAALSLGLPILGVESLNPMGAFGGPPTAAAYAAPASKIPKATIIKSAKLDNFKKIRQYDGRFSDIAKGDLYYSEIVRAYEYGIVLGTSRDKFSPTEKLDGGSALAIAARIHAIYEGKKINTSDRWRWYAPYAAYANKNGLVGSELAGKLDEPLNRAEMVRAWSKILDEKDLPLLNTVGHRDIPDVYDPEYVSFPEETLYYADIFKFYRAGITTGVNARGAFLPDSNVTRAEATAIFLRLVEPESRKGFVPDLSREA